jgi:hypothetical protein
MTNFKIDFCDAQQHVGVINFDFSNQVITIYFKPDTAFEVYRAFEYYLKRELIANSLKHEFETGESPEHSLSFHVLTSADKYFIHFHIQFSQDLNPKMVETVFKIIDKFQDKDTVAERLALQENYNQYSYLPNFLQKFFANTKDTKRLISNKNINVIKNEFLNVYHQLRVKKSTDHFILESLTQPDDTLSLKRNLVSKQSIEQELLPYRCDDLHRLSLVALSRSNLGINNSSYTHGPILASIGAISVSVFIYQLFKKKTAVPRVQQTPETELDSKKTMAKT